MKTLTFYSNYFNHHQKALCDAFYERLGQGFHFIETEPMEKFREKMGWGGEKIPPYVLKTYQGKENERLAMDMGRESDAVMIGTAPERFIDSRLLENKLTFRYTERPMKEGMIKMFHPRLAKKFYKLHYKNRNRQVYVLGASAYASEDYRKMGSYLGKCMKFGYFPKVIQYDIEELMKKKSDKRVEILSAGRLLKLKRIDLLIEAAAKLKEKGYDFHVTIIGDGEEEGRLKALAYKKNLGKCIDFYGFMDPKKVREEMEKAHIFTMTSNFLEGWGSVIYEGLNGGFAVVASHSCGSTPWLINHEENGLIFQSGNKEDLALQLEKLFLHKEKIREYGRKGYAQIVDLWNPKTAAAHVLKAAKELQKHPEKGMKNWENVIKEGPCSVAPFLKNNWFCP